MASVTGSAKPIDGNRIVNDIQKQRARDKGTGFIHNRATGETVRRRSEPQVETTPTPQIQIPKDDTPQYRDNTAEMNDQMEADEGYANYAQAYEYETGRVPTYEEYQDYQDSAEPQEQMDEQQVSDAARDYLNDMGKLSDYMEQYDIPFDRLIEQLPEDMDETISTEDILEMLKDPRKMRTSNDVTLVGTAIDYAVDILDLDDESFFSGGEVKPCEEECKERRARQAQEREEQFNG